MKAVDAKLQYWYIIDMLSAFTHTIEFNMAGTLTNDDINSLPDNMKMPPDIMICLN